MVYHLKVAVSTKILCYKTIIDTITHEAGEVDGGDGQTQLLISLEVALDEGLESGEDGVVHHQLSLVHGHSLQGLGDLDEPVELCHGVSSFVENLDSKISKSRDSKLRYLIDWETVLH